MYNCLKPRNWSLKRKSFDRLKARIDKVDKIVLKGQTDLTD